ncbi:MAG TPA: hypothetical protein VHM00_00510 [Caldimonas sp.]|jgi:hypothetical protein|nr:hypothetical protein [Caldimonas sp.]HEX2539545.1 hypothetical protein [Caldimonas sp.]
MAARIGAAPRAGEACRAHGFFYIVNRGIDEKREWFKNGCAETGQATPMLQVAWTPPRAPT